MSNNVYVYGVAGVEGLGNDDRNAKTRLHDTVPLNVNSIYEKYS
jgi:hypothetical protein